MYGKSIPIPAYLAPLSAAFGRFGGAVYAVGGFVRNSLQNLPPSDIDVCSGYTPESLQAMLAGTDIRIIQKAPAFGTVELHFGDISVEHTTFRADSYAADGTHRPNAVRFAETPTEDAFRRDFTVNALYADLATGEVYDPTGGLADLAQGVLRAAAAPPERTMENDALRILRLARFSAELGFSVDPATFDAAKRHANRLAAIAPERIQHELDRILLSDAKYPSLGFGAQRGVLVGLTLLDELDVWPCIAPPMRDMRNLSQRSDHHRYDVLRHTFHVCAETPCTRTMRLAGLLHDIGKPLCRSETGSYRLHDRYGEALAREILTRLRYPADTVNDVCALVRYHMYDVQNTARDETLRTRFALWGRTLTERMIELREADVRGCGYNTDYVNARWRTLYQTMRAEGAPFSESELAVTGADIMLVLGIPAGKQVGQIKQKLFLHCARRPSDNTKPILMRLIRDCLPPMPNA